MAPVLSLAGWGVSLFCGKIGLFCGNVGLFCENTGLFGEKIGLFCGDTGLFCPMAPVLSLAGWVSESLTCHDPHERVRMSHVTHMIE